MKETLTQELIKSVKYELEQERLKEEYKTTKHLCNTCIKGNYQTKIYYINQELTKEDYFYCSDELRGGGDRAKTVGCSSYRPIKEAK